MTVRKWETSLLIGAVALAAIAVPARAQENADGRWLPFVGCWEPLDAEPDAGLLCFTPADGGVQMSNMAAGEAFATEQLVADGEPRPVSAEGCEGWESITFSDDGQRAFTRSEFACGTDTPRTGTGVMSFTSPNQWVDVRSLDVDGESIAWVQEYRLVGIDRLAEEGVSDPAEGLGMAVRTGRMVAARPIDVADVQEAVSRLDEKAAESWVAAQRDRFDLSADDIVRLADSGMPESVIDVMVAVSYPDRFVVRPSEPIEEADGGGRPAYAGYRGYMGYSPFFGLPGFGFGYNYGYGYSPFGYSGLGRGYGGYYGGYGGYGGAWGYRTGAVIIDRRPSGGRVYNGRGYSKGSSGRGSGSARPSRGPSYSGGGRASAGSGRVRSGSGSRTGRAGGSSGRTARRRGGGD